MSLRAPISRFGVTPLVSAMLAFTMLAFTMLAFTMPAFAGCSGDAKPAEDDAAVAMDVAPEGDAAPTDASPLLDASVSSDTEEQADVAGDSGQPGGVDVRGGTPEVSIEPQPLGGVCARDEQCALGVCLDEYAGGYCTQACESADECPDGGACYPDPRGEGRVCWKRCETDDGCRTDQFCAEDAGLCVPRCREGECQPGYDCDVQTGICVRGAHGCQPEEESCDLRDNDCDGYVDEGCALDPSTPDSVGVLDVGKVYAGGGGLTRDVSFDVPEGVSSFTIVLVAEDDGLMVLWELRAPTGGLLVDGGDLLGSPNRTFPQEGAYAIQVPNTPSVEVAPGEYTFTFYKEGERGYVDVLVFFKNEPSPRSGTLDLNLYFVGTGTLDAERAPTHSRFQGVLREFGEVYGAADIELGQVRYLDVPEDVASRLAILDISSGPDNEMSELLRCSEGDESDGLNIFFVKGIQQWGTLGIAGGIPGPPFVHGTPGSGVVVNLGDFLSGWMEEDATAEVMAHEVAHQLGLFHVSEQDGTMHDTLGDTAECSPADDVDGDGMVATWECRGRGAENLMFWAVSGGVELTADQRWVLWRNAQVR